MKRLKYMKLPQSEITEQQFKQIMVVENSTGSGYSEDEMRYLWVDGNINDNFVCMDNNKIVAHITYNPKSKRRNGSIYMVNLTVLPEYRHQGIAKKLILEACNYYCQLGQTLPMSTSVDKTNNPAINLYKKCGFEIKDPICELDKDDEQFILEAPIATIIRTIEKDINKMTHIT
jgi:ribosomal protein S18 acetylase RimI-like enzyme